MSVEILNIDCMEYMRQQPDKSFDLAIVDPPYGINISSNPVRQKHEKKLWDLFIPNKEYFDIDCIEVALNELYTTGITNVNWIEQSAYSYMFHKNEKYIRLNDEKYQIPTSYNNVSENIEALHFVGHPPIRRLYNGFL